MAKSILLPALLRPHRSLITKVSRSISSVVPKSDLEVRDFTVKNEPVLSYMPNSPERAKLEKALKEHSSNVRECPIVIGGKEYRTDQVQYQVMPHNHGHRVAKFYYATPDLIKKAIETSLKAKIEWERRPLQDRMDLFLRVADLMADKYRADLNATTMLGQSKTVVQAEIDAAAELIDFFRFNSFFGKELLKYQPISEQPQTTLNLMRYRSLEGFVASISPFNFTAIAGNLGFTPAIMGNGVVWKPSDTAILSNYTILKIFEEAGLPEGVVNFVPSEGQTFGKTVVSHPQLAAINFTGSVPTFQWLWQRVGENLPHYTGFPKLIGECGGKNYHFVHPSAEISTVVSSTLRSAFEYQGQKCSACSRLYVPKSLWTEVKEGLIEGQKKLKMGDVAEFDTFMGAVIDAKAFDRISKHLKNAQSDRRTKVVVGGKCENELGYFIEPTVVETSSPDVPIFKEELFGPVVTAFVYEDKDLDATLNSVADHAPYALTGSVYSQDQQFAEQALDTLKGTAGNFYVNDKSTGSIVGQQPFGGAKLSGTNDKAGGPHYMLKWASPQAIKQTFVPLKEVEYPYMRK